jgi:predicted phage replisome organizer
MAEVKWIKITTDIFDDEKILLIESLPDSYAIITVWFKLLCLAGKQNNSGVFLMGRIPYTDKMLATIFRMKETTVTLALKTFEDFGMIEIVDGVITIPNWGKHQNLDQLESKKQYMRNYMAEYREKQKALTSGKSNCKTNGKANVSQADKEEDIDKDKDKDKEDIYSFDEFWSAYPKKKAKEAAKKAWAKLKPDESLGKTIIQAVIESAKTKDWKKENGKYIPYPATYLNGKRWEDERNESNGQNTGNTRKVQYGTVI